MTSHHYVYYSYEEWGRGYLGVRTCPCSPEFDTEYWGSFVDKTFMPTQKIIIAEFFTRKEAMLAEILLHNFFDVGVNTHFANLSKATSTGFDRTGVVISEKTKKKMSDSKIGKIASEETRQKLSKAASQRRHSEETKRKMSEAHIGKEFTEEHKEKISKTKTGKKHPKLSEKMLGEKNHNFGKKWYTHENGECRLSEESPGPEWKLGRKLKSLQGKPWSEKRRKAEEKRRQSLS